MERFEWAEQNLHAESPHELQSRGVNVYFAPQIAPNVTVVDLADGRTDIFQDGARRPDEGYFVDFETLERYCREQGVPLVVTNGQVVLQPAGTGEAGDPLTHGGR